MTVFAQGAVPCVCLPLTVRQVQAVVGVAVDERVVKRNARRGRSARAADQPAPDDGVGAQAAEDHPRGVGRRVVLGRQRNVGTVSGTRVLVSC